MGYAAVLDPYPHQTKEYNQLYRFYELLREGKLCTTKCVKCGHVTWPPKTMCPKCASGELEWHELPADGTVMGYTVAEGGLPPHIPVPAIFVLVQLGPVRILARLLQAKPEDVEIGMRVKPTCVVVEGTPYAPDRVLPAFVPAEAV
jgi:uncharacterized OB-fold protein